MTDNDPDGLAYQRQNIPDSVARIKELMTVENIVEWLKTQDLERTYDYADNRHCLFSRYLKDTFGKISSVTPGYVFLRDYSLVEYPKELEYIVEPGEGDESDWNYRDAYARALELMENRD